MVLIQNGGFATAALQNGFCTYELSLHKSQYLLQNDKKHYIVLLSSSVIEQS
jgi:hypothetical protein